MTAKNTHTTKMNERGIKTNARVYRAKRRTRSAGYDLVSGKDQMKTKMQTCPFCGSTPVMEPWHGGGRQKRMISCQCEDCHVRPMVSGETPKIARHNWNTRAPISVVESEIVKKAIALAHNARLSRGTMLPDERELSEAVSVLEMLRS